VSHIFSLHAVGQVISATGASAITQWSAGAQANAATTSSILSVSNPGPVGVYITSGPFASSPVATPASQYVPPGTVRHFKRHSSHDCVALLSAGATQSVTITHGGL